jgi:porphobilinogen deaminase
MTPDEGGTVLRLHGRVIALDGETMVEGREVGTVTDEKSAALLGTRLADRLLAEGAGEILADVRTASAPGVTEP